MLQNPHGSSNLTAYSLSPARLSLSAAGAKGQCMDLANITWRDLLWLRVLKRTSYIGKITKAARENIHRTWEAQQLLFPYIIPKKVSVPRLQRKLAPWSMSSCRCTRVTARAVATRCGSYSSAISRLVTILLGSTLLQQSKQWDILFMPIKLLSFG